MHHSLASTIPVDHAYGYENQPKHSLEMIQPLIYPICWLPLDHANVWFGDVQFVISDGHRTEEIKSGKAFIIAILSSGAVHFINMEQFINIG
jgi:hypothetical protein